MRVDYAADLGSGFFKMAMDSCPDLVFVKDQDFRILYANSAMLDLYPSEVRAGVIGSTTVESFSKEEADVFLAKDRETFVTGHTNAVEEIMAYTGETRTFSTTKTRFADDAGHIRLLGIATDISALMEREKQLASANSTLQHFAAIAAHDLVNPLNSVSMMMQLVQADRNTALSSKASTYLGDASLMIGSMSNRVQALLAMYKAYGGRALDVDEIDLMAVMNSVKLGLSSLLDAADAKLIYDDLPFIPCHSVLVEALIHNLVENSIKYRSTEELVVHVSCRWNGNQHVFAVMDNGVGMSKADGEHAFGLGNQLDGNSSGAGLGLSMCKSIVELHGGTLWIDETPAKGLSINFTLAPAT